MFFKSIIGIVCTCITFASLNVNATPAYSIISNGELIGINGLSVGSGTYDMTLHAGSFDTLFAADSSSVYDSTFADLADQSLHAFMLSSYAGSGLSALDILGCSDPDLDCFIATIYDNSAVTLDGFATVIEGNVVDPGLFNAFPESNVDYAYLTYATYKESTVPEPSIALLMASGLIAFGVVRRKARDKIKQR